MLGYSFISERFDVFEKEQRAEVYNILLLNLFINMHILVIHKRRNKELKKIAVIICSLKFNVY